MKRKQTKEFYSEIDQIADKQAFVESISEGFKEVNDCSAPQLNRTTQLALSSVEKLKDAASFLLD